MEAVDRLRQDGVAAGVITLYVLRPFPAKELRVLCHNASTILVADRQDSYGAGGGNMSLELKAALSSLPHPPRILSRIYGLGGKDFFVEDALALFKEALSPDAPAFDYYGVTAGTEASDEETSALPAELTRRWRFLRCSRNILSLSQRKNPHRVLPPAPSIPQPGK